MDLLDAKARGGGPEGLARGTRDGFANDGKELSHHGVLGQGGVGHPGGLRLGEAVGEEDEGRAGAHASQVDEDIAMCPPLEPVIDDDDVGRETRRAVRGGGAARESEHPEAGLSVKDVLDESLKRRGFHRNEDTAALHLRRSTRDRAPFTCSHEERLVTAPPAVD